MECPEVVLSTSGTTHPIARAILTFSKFGHFGGDCVKRHELRADRSFFSCRRQLNDSLRAVPLAMATATELVWTGAGTEAPTGATDFQKAVWPNAGYYESLRASLRLTDFNPLTVDWTKPVPWGNDPATCDSENMSEDKGCMMPLGVGLCARPPSRLPIAHPKHARSSRAAPLSWALDCSSPL